MTDSIIVIVVYLGARRLGYQNAYIMDDAETHS